MLIFYIRFFIFYIRFLTLYFNSCNSYYKYDLFDKVNITSLALDAITLYGVILTRCQISEQPSTRS